MTFTMPELTVMHIGLLAAALILGVIVGWIFRGSRSNTEKDTINASWQERLDAQRVEMERLLEQNRDLMEQNSQYQASNKDSKMRSNELSDALKEAFESRDELQRQIKDIRSNLEATIAERDQLQVDKTTRAVEDDTTSAVLKQRDVRIAKLSSDLVGWRERLPPLIERFRVRNEEADQLQHDLVTAQNQIVALEAMVSADQTRAEPVDSEALGDDLAASNDPIDVVTVYEEPETMLQTESMLKPAAGEDEPGDDIQDDEPGDDIQDDELSDDIRDDVASIDTVDGAARDDLKTIKGIGPAIEKTLNEMGICRFVQIADMSEYDIDRVAQRLKGFRSRIYREDWIGQARDLQDQKLSGQA